MLSRLVGFGHRSNRIDYVSADLGCIRGIRRVDGVRHDGSDRGRRRNGRRFDEDCRLRLRRGDWSDLLHAFDGDVVGDGLGDRQGVRNQQAGDLGLEHTHHPRLAIADALDPGEDPLAFGFSRPQQVGHGTLGGRDPFCRALARAIEDFSGGQLRCREHTGHLAFVFLRLCQ